MRYFIAILAIFFYTSLPMAAQQKAIAGDTEMPAAHADTASVNRLNAYAAKIQFSDPLKAIRVIETSLQLCNDIKYPYGAAVAYDLRAGLLFYEMKLDSSKLLLDKAYGAIKNNTDQASRSQVASILNRYAAIYQRRQNYDSAVANYLQAMTIFTQNGEELKIINSFYNLSGIYKYLNDTVKVFFYARETSRLSASSNNPSLVIRGLITLADAYNYIHHYDSAVLIARKGLKMAEAQSITFAVGIFNNFIGLYYLNKTQQVDSAIHHYNAALLSFEKINTPYDIALVTKNLGHAYLKKKDYPNAIRYAQKAVQLAQTLKFEDVLTASLLDLVQAKENAGSIEESYAYLKQYVQVSDSVQRRNSQKKVFDLEAKFNAQKKELEMAAQQNIIEQKSKLNYLLAGCIFLLLFTVFLLFLNYRHKQKLHQQRILDLEMQQQLTATAAVLKGEEQERTRLARDLHDGLGGMLSGIKYSLTSMQGNMVLTPDNALAFDRSMDMLNSSISEMRRVAHNMMPEALVKFGLDTALKDFCADINQSGALQIVYQSFGLDNNITNQTITITIYRIVQELINNSIKHAAAKTAIVQISKAYNLLSVTVEDDGKGFDTAILNKAKGIGWSNIQSRIDFLKGKIDVQSSENKGTSVHIEINI